MFWLRCWLFLLMPWLQKKLLVLLVLAGASVNCLLALLLPGLLKAAARQ